MDVAGSSPVSRSTSSAGGVVGTGDRLSRRSALFPPDLIQLICDRRIDPGKVFDVELPLDQAAEGYRAMDEPRATRCSSDST